jgi:hypothetical protein
VIGPVAAAAIIAGLAFWIWKLRKRPAEGRIVYLDPSGRAELDLQAPSMAQQYHQGPFQPLQSQLVEAPDQPIIELPASYKEK